MKDSKRNRAAKERANAQTGPKLSAYARKRQEERAAAAREIQARRSGMAAQGVSIGLEG